MCTPKYTVVSIALAISISSGCKDSGGQAVPVPTPHRSAGPTAYSDLLADQKGKGFSWGCRVNPADSSAARKESEHRYWVVHSRPYHVAAAVRRLDKLGFAIDLSVYQDLPPGIAVGDIPRLIEAAEAVAALAEGFPQAKRTKHWLANHHRWMETGTMPRFDRSGTIVEEPGYPMWSAQSEEDGEEPLPLIFVPDPHALRVYLNEEVSGGRLNRPIDAFIDDGVPYGFNVVFAAWTREPSWRLETAATGMPELGGTRGIQYGGEPYYHQYAAVPALGKGVVQREGLSTIMGDRRVAQSGGPELFGVVASVRIFDRVFLVEVLRPDRERCRFLAFSVADANGGARMDRPVVDEEFGGRFENSLRSELPYDERVGRYSLLRVPLPRPSGEYGVVNGHEIYPQERFVVNDDLAGLDPPVVVFRKAPTWRPFMPDYVLDDRLSFFGEDADIAEFVVAFANIEPEPLLRLLGALRNVDITPLLEDAELMERLKVR